MAAASQLACRAGPSIYITLAFHRSPLTRRCLGPRPGGPEVPGATRGLRQPVKTQPCLGSPGPGEGRDSSLLWALGPGPQASSLPASHGGRRRPLGAAASSERGLSQQRGPPRTQLQVEFPERARSSHRSRKAKLQRAVRGATGQASPGIPDAAVPDAALNHWVPRDCNPGVPRPGQLKSQSETFLLRSSFPPGSNGPRDSNSRSAPPQPFPDAHHEHTQPGDTCSLREDKRSGRGSGLTS